MHDHFSPDSKETIRNYALKMQELGIDCLSFTNHVDYDYKGRDFIYDFLKEKEEIESVKEEFPSLHIYQGVEIGFSIGKLEQIKALVKAHQFNVVNFSLHSDGEKDFYYKEEFLKYGPEALMEDYFRLYHLMLENFTDFDVLAHIDYGYKAHHFACPDIPISQYEKELIYVFKKVIELDKTLEINTKVQEGIDDESHLRYLLRLYRSLGGRNLTLSSDAHQATRLCSSFNKYMKIIKEEGFDHLCYFIDRKRYNFPI